MAEINLRAIEEKCRRYSNTTAGKRRMRQAVRGAVREGRKYTGCGDKVASFETMTQLANELIQTLQVVAGDATYGLPYSVQRHFNSLEYMVMDGGDGTYEFAIYFADDLSRPSLWNDQDCDGIHNIVALFNNGYLAAEYTYGWWEDHNPTGEWSLYTSGYGATDAYIRSEIGRPSLHFMQRAVQDFLAKYQAQYNIQVELDPYSYDGDYIISRRGTALPPPNN